MGARWQSWLPSSWGKLHLLCDFKQKWGCQGRQASEDFCGAARQVCEEESDFWRPSVSCKWLIALLQSQAFNEDWVETSLGECLCFVIISLKQSGSSLKCQCSSSPPLQHIGSCTVDMAACLWMHSCTLSPSTITNSWLSHMRTPSVCAGKPAANSYFYKLQQQWWYTTTVLVSLYNSKALILATCGQHAGRGQIVNRKAYMINNANPYMRVLHVLYLETWKWRGSLIWDLQLVGLTEGKKSPMK